MRRAGCQRGDHEALRLEDEAMFDRYNIIDEADLDPAVAKLSNGTVATQSGFTRGFGSGKSSPA